VRKDEGKGEEGGRSEEEKREEKDRENERRKKKKKGGGQVEVEEEDRIGGKRVEPGNGNGGLPTCHKNSSGCITNKKNLVHNHSNLLDLC
jgi:hypothetical protein